MDHFLSIKGFAVNFALFITALLFREYFEYRGKKFFKYLLTPFVTLLCAGFVIIAIAHNGLTTGRAIILSALLFSIIADTMLMVEETDLMIHGVIYFFMAHILYIAAFSRGYEFRFWHIIAGTAIFLSLIPMIRPIMRSSGTMFMPLIAYIAVISVMVFFAVTYHERAQGPGSIFAVPGAVLFLISDTVLAIDRFIKKIPHGSVVVWSIYGPAQMFLAWTCF